MNRTGGKRKLANTTNTSQGIIKVAKKLKKMPNTKVCFVNHETVRQKEMSAKKFNEKATIDIGLPVIRVKKKFFGELNNQI